MKSKYGKNQHLLDEYKLPASYVVNLSDLTLSSQVQETINGFENVRNIASSQDTIQKLVSVANGVRFTSIVILVLLVLISTFIISNTIKLTVHARRKEISIMKYVGATNSFIRGPFLVEGVIIGIIAACITIVLITFAYDFVISGIQSSLVLQKMNITLLQYSEILKSIIVVYMILGVGIGMFGSAFSMKKYLEV